MRTLLQRWLFLLLLAFAALFNLEAKDYAVRGPRDGIVPTGCSDRYKETYGDNATLKLIDGENHTITCRREQVVSEVVDFFKKNLGL